MQLKSLELVGFKSFPEKTLINFSAGITAIVGPNGSGKSNISDALRWVMGETSTKSLRGLKMEDIIFDGTQSRKSLGFAEVTLTLDNSDNLLPVDYDDVAITRRYYRSGDSEYYINKTPVKMRDIHDLLRDTGLGRSGYSIVSQGTATEIINAKSGDRRCLFEEASGISKFRSQKEESERKLSLTKENLIRLNDIKTEIEDRLCPLEMQAKKAKKYLDLYERKKKLEVSVWIDDIHVMEKESEKISENLEALKRSVEKCENEISECERLIELQTENIRFLTTEIESIRNENSEVFDKIRKCNSEILVLKNDSEHADRDITRFEEQQSNYRQQIIESSKILDENSVKISNLSAEISEKEYECDEKFREFQEYELRESALAEQANLVYDKLSSFNVRLTDLKIKQGRLREQILSSEERKKQFEKDIAAGEENLREMNDLRSNLIEKIASIDSERKEQKNTYEEFLRGINDKRAQKENAANLYSELKKKCDEKKARKRILEELESHYEGFNGSVRNVMNAVNNGILKGVVGTVASVIKTDNRYVVAIETALGSSVQNIVTENEKSAKNCIYYLKSKNYGRATFLPLDTVSGKKLQISGISSCEGYIGIASDLVKCEPLFRGITEQLLGRVVIADTIDNATDIARRNGYLFRIVTLDGQVINPGGSLTGGSVAKGIGVLGRANEIELLTSEISILETKVRGASESLKAYTKEYDAEVFAFENLRDEIRSVDEEFIKKSEELKNGEFNIANAKKRIADLNSTYFSEMTRAKELSGIFEKNEKEMESLSLGIESAKEEKTQIEKISFDITKKKNIITEELHKIELMKTTIVKNREIVLTSSESVRKNLEAFKFGESEAEIQITEAQKKIESYSEKIRGLTSEIQSLEALNESRIELISQKNADREASESAKAKIYENEKHIFEQKEKLGREVERVSIKCEALKNERETLISKLWDEYEITVSDAYFMQLKVESKESAKNQISALKTSIRELGSVNVSAIDEFEEVGKRYNELSSQLCDLESSKKSLENIVVQLEGEMSQIFAERFNTINSAFEETFKILFNGGTARLTLTNPEQVLESGIDIYVAPPGKIIKHLSSLSGGEQSLTAIALYFALLKINPAPFCLLDEIESALDDVNVVRYANYLKNLTKKTQFLVITHRRGTMEAADRLYGVTMREKGVSKIITINVNEIEKNMLG